jgi:hypothetical protein
MQRSKIQFDSGNQIYDVHLFIPLDFNGTKEEIEEIIDNHASWIKSALMVKCGYGLEENGEWVKKWEPINF